MIKILNLTVDRIIIKTIKDKETSKEIQLAKVLYINVDEDFYIGYLSMYDVQKTGIEEGMQVQAIYDQGKIKILGWQKSLSWKYLLAHWP